MTEMLEAIISPKNDNSHLFNDLSPAGIKREATRWRLIDSSHIYLYMLWSSYKGMSGESLRDLWEMSKTPGSAELFHDFAIIAQYKKRLEANQKFHQEGFGE